LHDLSGIKEVTLTTNGSLLREQARAIYDAGVRRLNISLDTLNRDRFAHITDCGDIDSVLKGIESAVEIGFSPIKLNAVIIKGFNDDEVIPLCKFAAERGLILRFIEFMPIGNSPDWEKKNIFTGKDILDIIGKEYAITEAPKPVGAGPARHYILSDGTLIGLITPMSAHFCNECDKLRLTADGKLRPCLLSDMEISVRDAIKSRNEPLFTELVHRALSVKNKEHAVGAEFKKSFSRPMQGIGG
jgi:cyclic pyranopterin phosphate synthase